jgi:hypothetical protein
MSEGLSVQYEDAPGSGSSSAGPSKTGKKWRLHFAKPPTGAEAMAIKPVSTAALAEKLELDGETVSFCASLSVTLLIPPPANPRGVPSTSGSFFLSLYII